MKIHIHTFGCQMNEADSAELQTAMAARGYEPVPDPKAADFIIINTCTVRNHAEQRALSYIGRLKFWKAAAPNRRIMVAGCAAEKLGGAIKHKFPFVDYTLGAKSMNELQSALSRLDLGRAGHSGTTPHPPKSSETVSMVTIMRGCDFRCSYCVVPLVRGGAVCRPPEEVLGEAAQKAEAGAGEIVLLGQTVNSYSHKNCRTFSQLLKRLHDIPAVKRIRFMSPHPAYISDELIEVMADNPKIARHLHMPVQSGSDRVLKLMNRGYTRASIEKTIAKLRTRIADVAISTDFIVGFPSESGSDFADTVALAEDIKFSFAYCFKYSPREGTAACAAEQNPQEETQARLSALLETVRGASRQRQREQEGKECEVLFETPHSGKTSSNYWVHTKENSRPGDIKRVLITSSSDKTLTGRILP